jgi:hypothetical protein
MHCLVVLLIVLLMHLLSTCNAKGFPQPREHEGLAAYCLCLVTVKLPAPSRGQ